MFRSIPFGVLPKLIVAVLPVLAAVGLLALLSLSESDRSVASAARIEREFNQRAKADALARRAYDDLAIVEQRLGTADGGNRASVRQELESSRRALNLTMAVVRDDVNHRRASRVRPAWLVVATYGVYSRTRQRIHAAVERRGTHMRPGEVDRLHSAFGPFRDALTEFSNAHHAEARSLLLEQRRGETQYRRMLLASVAFTALTLLAVVLTARRIAVRLGEKARFAARVASGDLDARLRPRGRDEVTALGRSLDAMVEQLAHSALEREAAREAERAERAARETLAEALQVADSEQEAHGLLKRHIERVVPGSSVVVLKRNNSEDRLEAATAIPEASAMGEALESAQPRACLAVRLARPHVSDDGASSLLECEICGAAAGPSTCVPLLVSGEVIGSVLVEHPETPEPAARRSVEQSVAQAAPSLANLRNLSVAEARAATDALTGLPNRRSMDDTLKRLIAQSDRQGTPLAAVMLDLDHFKAINDRHGHDHGDLVLAGVADVLGTMVRGTDFAARTGGEEFVVLLPTTDSDGAVRAAEKLRSAIETRMFPGLERPVTASLGVALYPRDAADPETLMRLADRALYTAKRNGRNRVEAAGSGESADEAAWAASALLG